MVHQSMINNKSILIMLHCEQDTGYAIGKLENVFRLSALNAGYCEKKILWSYSTVNRPEANIYEMDYQSDDSATLLEELIEDNKIDTILAFDLPYPTKITRTARRSGVKNIVSYWGASMSSHNHGLKLLLKRSQWYIQKYSAPNLFIFESKAMQHSATNGRGVPAGKTCVIPLGVDTSQYYPSGDKSYIKDELNIPGDRKVIFYSGHMEERKGIRIIMKTARYLEEKSMIANIHFVLCGNKRNEADTYLDELSESRALSHVTFAGYRNDVPALMRSSDIGVIASTGWDSFTRSSVEMMASGIPLLASNLGGLAETTKHSETGFLFEAGNYKTLANYIYQLAMNDGKRNMLSLAARQRAIDFFDEKDQIFNLSKKFI